MPKPKPKHSNHFCDPPAPNTHWTMQLIYVHMMAEHMTRKELARQSGVSEGFIIDLWRGRYRNPKIGMIEALLGVFDLSFKVTGGQRTGATPGSSQGGPSLAQTHPIEPGALSGERKPKSQARRTGQTAPR